MPAIVEYFTKLSIGLSIVCIFYYVFLRRLTFYNWNRWYLLGYTVLACLLPFFNVVPLLERNDLINVQVIRSFPAISLQMTSAADTGIEVTEGTSVNTWPIAKLVFEIGALLLLMRLIVRLFSFMRIKRQSKPIQVNGMKVYQLDRPIKPFSFGNAIFINSQLHTPDELKEIIRHEFIHIRQKHTVDILWAEFLVIINWYNPFAWILRSAIRQNLEFIADSKVIETGVDRKSYQYLLLKVIGSRNFAVANNFNYSSLKTRIAMMNKIKSARIHLLRFLFILPLLATLLLSFREGMEKQKPTAINCGGIAFDIATNTPIAGASIVDLNTGSKTTTNSDGYFLLSFDGRDEMDIKLQITKQGFIDQLAAFSFKRSTAGTRSLVEIIGMKKGEADAKCDDCFSSMSLDHVDKASIDYQDVKKSFDTYLSSMEERKKSFQEEKEIVNKKPTGIIIETSDILIADEKGKMCAMGPTNVTIEDNAQGLIIANNKEYSPAEFKLAFKPGHTFPGATMYQSAIATERFGKKGENGVLILGKAECENKAADIPTKDTTPVNSRGFALHHEDGMSEDATRFFNRNPKVAMLYWKPRSAALEVYLKTGEIELYEMPAKQRDFEKKYGQIPIQQGSRGRSISNMELNEKGYFLSIVDNNGECTVSVLNKEKKEIARVPLNNWSKEDIENYGVVAN